MKQGHTVLLHEFQAYLESDNRSRCLDEFSMFNFQDKNYLYCIFFGRLFRKVNYELRRLVDKNKKLYIEISESIDPFITFINLSICRLCALLFY